jgi:hypothetical protein
LHCCCLLLLRDLSLSHGDLVMPRSGRHHGACDHGLSARGSRWMTTASKGQGRKKQFEAKETRRPRHWIFNSS